MFLYKMIQLFLLLHKRTHADFKKIFMAFLKMLNYTRGFLLCVKGEDAY